MFNVTVFTRQKLRVQRIYAGPNSKSYTHVQFNVAMAGHGMYMQDPSAYHAIVRTCRILQCNTIKSEGLPTLT